MQVVKAQKPEQSSLGGIPCRKIVEQTRSWVKVILINATTSKNAILQT